MAAERPPRVFISYSHDSDAHAARVLQLANDLRRDGVEAILDQYLTSPPEGWHRWMDGHIRDADFVVMVCTDTYYRRVIGKEEPGEGLGVRWEGNLIYAHLYGSGVDLSRFVPVLTDGCRREHIPEAVHGASYYFVDKPRDYGGLLRRLFNQPVATMPPVAERRPLPALPAQWHQRPPGALHNVPELPPHFVPRADMLEGLREKLLAADAGTVGVTGAAVKVGVQGMGGIGKSVLAAALARDDRVRAAFPAGVFWVPLGQTPDLLPRQSDLHRQLTGEPGSFTDAQQGKVALQEALRGRVCLVVLDDVWRMADAEAFNVIDGQARLLLTTRDAAIVRNLGAREHRVQVLDRADSLQVLAQTARVPQVSLPREADAIADECGDLPLALALAGGMIGGQADMWGPVLEALRSADIEQIEGEFPGYPYPHVFAAIEASVNALREDRDRYLDLAIFPEDVPVPEPVLQALWGVGALKARTLITRLRDRSLAAVDEQNRLSLHDLQRDFVRKRAEDQPGRHQRLLEAWRQQCPSGWASGPGDADNGYFFRHLPLHLAQAGRRDDLRDLLLNYAWLKAKLTATDVAALLADYAQTEDPDLGLVGRALMLSAHIIRSNACQLPTQIIGRLGELNKPLIDTLVATAQTDHKERWFRPITRSLIPPGVLLRTFVGHESWVTVVAVLADGRRALSGSQDRTLRLWDVETGTELRQFKGHEGPITAVGLLPDGRRALSGSEDRTLRLWDVETGAELRRFKGHEDKVTAVALLPDGRRALSGSDDWTLRLWDLNTGKVQRLLGHKRGIKAVMVSAKGRRAISMAGDGALQLWDLESRKELRRLSGYYPGDLGVRTARNISSEMFTLADGRALVRAGHKALQLWDVETGTKLREFEGRMLGVTAITLLADGRHALSGSYYGTVQLSDLETGRELWRFDGHGSSSVQAVALLPDGRRALSAGADRTLRLWDVPAEMEVQRFEGHKSEVKTIAMLPDGRCALSGSEDRTLRLWDLETGTELRRFKGHKGCVTAVVLLPDGRRALSASDDRTLRLWDVETGTELRRFEGRGGWATAMVLLPDGRRALSASDDRTLRLWDVETGTELRRFERHAGWENALALLPDGRCALVASWAGAQLWDVETWRELRRFEGHFTTALAVLPEGRHALSGSFGSLCLWDVGTGKKVRTFEGHEDRVASVAVMADGRRALSGSEDRTLRLWDLETGECLATFTGDAAITCVAVARDDLFVAGSANGAVHFLELPGPRLDL